MKSSTDLRIGTSMAAQLSSWVNKCNACTDLTCWVYFLQLDWIFVIQFPSLKQHIEASMQDGFTHPTHGKKGLVGHAAHLNSLKAMPHPAGGFLLKREARLSFGLRDSYRTEGGRLLCSQDYVPSIPSAIPNTVLHSWQPGSSSVRCQGDWLDN